MGFSFRKRIKVLPGITLNLSKSGISTTLGPKGARMTVGGKRGPRVTTSIPGTGLSFTQGVGARGRTVAGDQPAPPRRGSRVFWWLILFLAMLGLYMLVMAKLNA